MTLSTAGIEQLAINTIRTLSMDAVQKANCGHPGAPMALAPVAYVVWNRFLCYDPSDPTWAARDRFVLSCGHASMLLYSMLHLAGVKDVDAAGNVLGEPAVSLDEIKNFRQLHSRCAGHPEIGDAPGIESTTGPLGQGAANSVGMAIAARWLAARYDRPDFDLFGYNVYTLCSDGDLMEGVAAEAASLAGHLKLANLCWIYDDNHITIEGDTKLAFTEDMAARFEGLGWRVIRVDDANDLDGLNRALRSFHETDDRPTLVIVRSVIAFGSPNKADSHAAHGNPLGEEEIRLTKGAYSWPPEETFLVPDEVRSHFADGIGVRGIAVRDAWQTKFAAYESAYPELTAEWKTMRAGKLPDGWDKHIPTFEPDEKGLASRVSAGKVLNAIAAEVPWLLGGSADLAPSTMTTLGFDGAGHFAAGDYGGRNFHYGVREHAMAAVSNGMALAGLRPFASTFFIFSDYLRPAMRLSAVMRLPVIYVFTHDSIGLGEDGPTHQPVEHLAACRAIPDLIVIRPADANEVAEAYRVIMSRQDRPVALVLSRQALSTLDRTTYNSAAGTARGAYVLAAAPDGLPQAILIGTGSEVGLCLEARDRLAAEGVAARVVSMPSWELFEEQDQAYKDSVLPPEITARVAVEAGVAQGWQKYLGPAGHFIGMSSFGASAPAAVLMEHFGITAEHVAAAALDEPVSGGSDGELRRR